MAQHVYIATSLDGYIADKNNGIDWLHQIPNPDGNDFGFADFIADIDAIVMGRNTYEVVAAMDIPWPYPKPVVVLSSRDLPISEQMKGKVELASGTVPELLEQLSQRGYNNLYVDGGVTVQQFLQADQIDTLTVTQLPVLLGDGISLFGQLEQPLWWELQHSEVLLGQMVKTQYRRKR